MCFCVQVQKLMEQEVPSATETKLQGLIESIQKLEHGVNFERSIEKLEVSTAYVYISVQFLINGISCVDIFIAAHCFLFFFGLSSCLSPCFPVLMSPSYLKISL